MIEAKVVVLQIEKQRQLLRKVVFHKGHEMLGNPGYKPVISLASGYVCVLLSILNHFCNDLVLARDFEMQRK